VAVFEFIKMSGTGNDFIVADNRNGKIPDEAKPGVARTLCPRRTAVGADGLVLLEMSDTADVRMRIFNADGSEPEMCGNASRCLAWFARRLRAAGSEMMIETQAGVLRAEVDDHTVRVDMTRPKGVSSRGELEFAGESRDVFFADTGVPHAVVFVDDLDAVDISAWGKALRTHDEFQPAGLRQDRGARQHLHPHLRARGRGRDPGLRHGRGRHGPCERLARGMGQVRVGPRPQRRGPRDQTCRSSSSARRPLPTRSWGSRHEGRRPRVAAQGRGPRPACA